MRIRPSEGSLRNPDSLNGRGRDRILMKLYSPDRNELLRIDALARDGNDLLIRGKAFGSMPMTARLSPEQARQGLRLLNPR